jgi:flavorubredoxin
MMAPQHGRIFKGEAVQEFLEWFDNLEVGIVNS